MLTERSDGLAGKATSLIVRGIDPRWLDGGEGMSEKMIIVNSDCLTVYCTILICEFCLTS